MDYQACCDYLQNKPESKLSYPFDPEIPVYKVCNKMFALISPVGRPTPSNPNQAPSINLKCDPHHAQELRDVFASILPGYHMNKKHWNTLILDGSIPSSEIQRLIDHSYALVTSKLPKADKNRLEMHYPSNILYAGLSPYN